jgi:DUF4097 and DUF4098 domain-containing protein YvlB
MLLTIIFALNCGADVKYTKQVNLTIPAGKAQSFAAQTQNGWINVKGGRTTDCNLAAAIIVKADTEEIAKKIAEEVKISLLSDGNGVTVKIEKPKMPKDVQLNINLDANLPGAMNLSLVTHNGNVTVADVSGNTNASTHNGNVDYKGSLADLKMGTHNGNINIKCIEQSANKCEIIAETHNGNIDFAAPEDFSAAVDASTRNGSIRTKLLVSVDGKIGKDLKGTIGDGRDKLFLRTHNGSIKIK